MSWIKYHAKLALNVNRMH